MHSAYPMMIQQTLYQAYTIIILKLGEFTPKFKMEMMRMHIKGHQWGSGTNVVHDSYRTASGEIPFNMTNDYMFRVVFQEN